MILFWLSALYYSLVLVHVFFCNFSLTLLISFLLPFWDAYFLSKIHGADSTNNPPFDKVYLKTYFLWLFWLDPAQKPLSHRPTFFGQKGRWHPASGAFKPNQNQRLYRTLQESFVAPSATTSPEKTNLQVSAWDSFIEALREGGGRYLWILLKVRSTHVYLPETSGCGLVINRAELK